MKKFGWVAFIGLILLMGSGITHAQEESIVGIWSVPGLQGAERNQEKWQVEIYEKDGRYEGKYVKLSKLPEDAVCKTCKKDKKDQPLMGMVILWDLKRESRTVYTGGRVYDVEKGTDYRCTVSLPRPDTLKLEVCWLFICDTHLWKRIQ